MNSPMEIERPQNTNAWTRDDEEALLVEMLSHYTPSGEERSLSETLRDQMAARGLCAEVDAVGNLIVEAPATLESGTRARDPVVLLGHIDTVRGFIPVQREAGQVYGRGAVDAKGPLAAFLCALARLVRHPAPRTRTVIVVGAVEEEAATSAGARAVLERWHPAYAVIGEPSGTAAVTLGYKGRLLARYRVAQPVAHTARADDSACARAVALWNALAAHAAAWDVAHNVTSAFDALQLSLRGISSGSDGFVDWCELEVGCRLPPALSPDELERTLTAIAGEHEASQSYRGAEAAYVAPRHSPLVSAFMRAIREEGMQPRFKCKTGTSDMNVVAPVWRCPILAYGPGDAALDHTPGEHIALSEYFDGIAVLERVLIDLAAREDNAS
jgi:N-acetyl-ornithine/N-acetyl-lysine deacetylase